jgi:hypothetical protein
MDFPERCVPHLDRDDLPIRWKGAATQNIFDVFFPVEKRKKSD